MPIGGRLVLIRGPIGSGKTTLMRGLARRDPTRTWVLDCDAANSHHPGDPTGEHLRLEWPLEIELLALHARIVLGRGLDLVMDPGLLLTRRHVDRFLRLVGRTRQDPQVVLIRLSVSVPEAVRRKTTLKPSYVRASHRGWVTRPVAGEIVIETDGRTCEEVLAQATAALRSRSVLRTEPRRHRRASTRGRR